MIKNQLFLFLFIMSFFLLIFPLSAFSSIMELFGVGSRIMGMGGAGTGLASDTSALYYNPAALMLSDTSIVHFDFNFYHPHMTIDRYKNLDPYNKQLIDNVFVKREDGTVLIDPNSLEDALEELLKYKQQEVYPDGGMGISVGFVYAFKELENIIKLGFLLYLPTEGAYLSTVVNPISPQFYKYTSYPKRMLINLGLQFELPFGYFNIPAIPHVRISLGVSVDFFVNTSGINYLSPSYVDDSELLLNKYFLYDRRIIYELPLQAFVKTGLLVELFEMLNVGFAYRGETYHEVEMAINCLDVVDAVIIGQQYISIIIENKFTPYWTPMQIAAGISLVLEEIGLTVAFDLTYSRWSEAPNPSYISNFFIGSQFFNTINSELNNPAFSSNIELGFKDTYTPSFGIEYVIKDLANALDLSLRLGYTYKETPANTPNRGGTPEAVVNAPEGTLEALYYATMSNYIDTDTHIASVGMGLGTTFGGFLTHPLSLDIAFQLSILEEMKTNKLLFDGTPIDNQSSVIGNYKASGLVYGLNASLSYRFE